MSNKFVLICKIQKGNTISASINDADSIQNYFLTLSTQVHMIEYTIPTPKTDAATIQEILSWGPDYHIKKA